MNIGEFLTARLADRERLARGATPGPWRYNPGKEWHTDLTALRLARLGVPVDGGEEFVAAGPDDGDNATTICVAATGPRDDVAAMADAAFISTNDPTFVLADIAAKRRIIRHLAAVLDSPGPANPDDWTPYDYQNQESAQGNAAWMLKVLAAPFADHPDYREEWRP